MHHLAVESCLFHRLLVVREFHMGYTHTFTGLWIGQRPNGTGSGGAYILLIMHYWHYCRRSWRSKYRRRTWMLIWIFLLIFCLYILYFFFQGHVTTYVWEEWYNVLGCPHGWVMNVCLESFGHLWCMVDYGSSWRKFLLQIWPTARGSTISTTEQSFQHALRGSITLFPWRQRGRMTLRILGLPSSPKGKIVGIMTQVGAMAQVLTLMATLSSGNLCSGSQNDGK